MVPIIVRANPVDTWKATIQAVASDGILSRDKRKLHNVIAVAESSRPIPARIRAAHAGIVGAEPWQRTEQLYRTTENLTWKESYRARLCSHDDSSNQLANAINLLARSPGTSSACCCFMRSRDIRRAHVLPSSVPCPVVVDFKIVEHLLQATVLFRAQDVFRIGLPDLHHFAIIQREVLKGVIERRRSSDLGIGRLVFHLCVAFLQRSDLTQVAAAVQI